MKKILLSTLLILGTFLCANAIGFEWYGLSNTSGNYRVTDLTYNNNQIYGVGEFESSSIVVGGNTLSNSAASNSELFVFKADTMGTVVWSQKFGGTGNDKSNNLSVDNAGNVLVTGSFEGTATFGTNNITSNGAKDVFILKLNGTNGNTLWVKNIGGTTDDIGNDICSDYNNDVYFVATLKSAITFPNVTTSASATSYIGIGKLDDLGNEQWLKFTEGNPAIVQNDFGTSIKYNAVDSTLFALTTLKSNTFRMHDFNYFPFYSFFASPGRAVYFEFKPDSTLVGLNGYSSTALQNELSRDAVICDSSKFLSIDVPNTVAGSAASYIHYKKTPTFPSNTYHLYVADPIPYPNGPGFVSVPKLSCTAGELYAIHKYSNVNSPCFNSNINDVIHHTVNTSIFDSLDIHSFFNLPIYSLTSKGNSVYIGGEGYVAKVCQTSSCAISSIPIPLILNPAPDVTLCISSSAQIGRSLCDYIVSGTPPYTFTWTPSTALSATNIPNPITTTSVNQTYYLVVTDSLNNTGYDTVNVTITNGLISNLTLTASADTICRGDTIQFNATYNGTPSSYYWNSTYGSSIYNSVFSYIANDSISAVGVTNYSSTFSPNQLYESTITFSMYDSLGCQFWDTAVITILPSNVGISISPAAPICASDSLTLTATGLNSILWQGGIQNGVPFLTNINSNNYNIYNVSGIDTVTGCLIKHDTIVYNYAPTILANSSSNQNPVQVCPGGQVQLYGSGGSPPYTWNGGIQDSVPFAANNVQYYTVTAIDQNNCLSSDSIEVTFIPTTILAQSTNNQNPVLVCPGGQVQLFATGGVGAYTWNGGVNSYTPFIPTTSQFYTVSANDANGCYSSDSIFVSILPSPNITAHSSLNQNPASICIGDSILLYGSGGTITNWTGGINDSIPFLINSNQTFLVYGVDTNNCVGRDSIQVIVNPLPAPLLSFNGSSLNCTGVSSISSYNWFLNSLLFGGNASSQAITQNGQYIVEAIDSNGCSGFDTLNVMNLNTANTIKDNNITIYPNPTSGLFTISSTKVLNGKLELYDLLGKRIIDYPLSTRESSYDISFLASGNYFIKIISDGHSYFSKLTLD